MSSNLTAFTNDARRILAYATDMALERHNAYIDVEHIMLGVLINDDEPLRSVLRGVDRATVSEHIRAELGIVREAPLEQATGLTADVKRMLEDAVRQAREMGHTFVNGGHILLAMFHVNSTPIQEALRETTLNEQAARAVVAEKSPKIQETTFRQPQQPQQPQQRPVRMVFETARQRQQREAGVPQQRRRATGGNSIWTYILAALTGVAVYLAAFNPPALISFGLVLAAWIFSLCVHEFSHALVAYLGGDHTVRDKGYLSFNPIRYMHPVLSLLLPLMFLALGGIGLPGGAVYIEVHRLRSKWWRTAVSLAGPASNAILAVVFALPFILGIVELPSTWFWGLTETPRLEAALAFIVFLQVTATILNLLPIPPLDGFNALSEFLPPEMVRQARAMGFLALFLLFYLFRVPAFYEPFWQTIQHITDLLNVPWNLIVDGLDFFRFWQ